MTVWTGLVGQLSRREADLANSLLALTYARSHAIDYTLGYLENIWSLLVPKNPVGERSMSINARAFLTSFSLLSWVSILVLALAAALVSALIICYWNGCHVTHCLRHYGQGLFLMYLSFIQKSQYRSSDYPRYSGMVLFWVLCVFGFVVYTYFVADLTASMTTDGGIQWPRHFQDVLDQGYRVYTLKDTSLESYFTRDYRAPDSPIRKTYESNLELLSPKDKKQFLRLVQKLPRVAFFGSRITFFGTSILTVLTQFEDHELAQNAIGLQKDSELRDMFNYHILKMRQTGVLDQILQSWLTRRGPSDWSSRIFQDDPIALGYQNLFGPVAVLVAGIGSSFTIILLEIILKN